MLLIDSPIYFPICYVYYVFLCGKGMRLHDESAASVPGNNKQDVLVTRRLSEELLTKVSGVSSNSLDSDVRSVVVASLKVNLGRGKSGTIVMRDNDDVEQLADSFIKEHALPETSKGVIVSKLKKLKKPEVESVDNHAETSQQVMATQATEPQHNLEQDSMRGGLGMFRSLSTKLGFGKEKSDKKSVAEQVEKDNVNQGHEIAKSGHSTRSITSSKAIGDNYTMTIEKRVGFRDEAGLTGVEVGTITVVSNDGKEEAILKVRNDSKRAFTTTSFIRNNNLSASAYHPILTTVGQLQDEFVISDDFRPMANSSVENSSPQFQRDRHDSPSTPLMSPMKGLTMPDRKEINADPPMQVNMTKKFSPYKDTDRGTPGSVDIGSLGQSMDMTPSTTADSVATRKVTDVALSRGNSNVSNGVSTSGQSDVDNGFIAAVSVKIADDKTDEIRVHEGDNAQHLATAFVRKQGLPVSVTAILASQVMGVLKAHKARKEFIVNESETLPPHRISPSPSSQPRSNSNIREVESDTVSVASNLSYVSNGSTASIGSFSSGNISKHKHYHSNRSTPQEDMYNNARHAWSDGKNAEPQKFQDMPVEDLTKKNNELKRSSRSPTTPRSKSALYPGRDRAQFSRSQSIRSTSSNKSRSRSLSPAMSRSVSRMYSDAEFYQEKKDRFKEELKKQEEAHIHDTKCKWRNDMIRHRITGSPAHHPSRTKSAPRSSIRVGTELYAKDLQWKMVRQKSIDDLAYTIKKKKEEEEEVPTFQPTLITKEFNEMNRIRSLLNNKTQATLMQEVGACEHQQHVIDDTRSGCSFKPEINKRSEKLAQKRRLIRENLDLSDMTEGTSSGSEIPRGHGGTEVDDDESRRMSQRSPGNGKKRAKSPALFDHLYNVRRRLY